MQSFVTRRNFLRGVCASATGLIVGCGTGSETVVPAESLNTYYYGNVPIEMQNIIFPSWWKGFEAQTIPQRQRRDKLELLLNEIELYPLNVLEDSLETVYYVQILKRYGNVWGGTRNLNGPNRKGTLWTAHQEVFHGEFSSILMDKYKDMFPEDEWLSCVPSHFSYTGYDLTQPLPNYSNFFSDPINLQNGFIGDHSRISLEDDFNDVFEFMMQKAAKLFDYADRYHLLGIKTELAIDFTSRVFGKQLTREDFISRRKPLA